LSGRERALMAIAEREVDPAHFREFEPITRGPVLAWLTLPALALLALAWRGARLWRQLGEATSRAGLPCRQSKPGHRATNGSDPSKKWPSHLRPWR
jgi:hypothetical protein